jgi:hypothetical protein
VLDASRVKTVCNFSSEAWARTNLNFTVWKFRASVRLGLVNDVNAGARVAGETSLGEWTRAEENNVMHARIGFDARRGVGELPAKVSGSGSTARPAAGPGAAAIPTSTASSAPKRDSSAATISAAATVSTPTTNPGTASISAAAANAS